MTSSVALNLIADGWLANRKLMPPAAATLEAVFPTGPAKVEFLEE